MPTYATNGKAHFNYEILDEYEAGIELLGFEVKSVRAGKGQLQGARVLVRGGEAFLVGFELPPYQAKNTPEDYDMSRTRKLLLSKSEIKTLAEKSDQKGLTVIPLSLYTKGTKIKIKIAVVRGKKKFDKRETIKKRDTGREMSRLLKGGR